MPAPTSPTNQRINLSVKYDNTGTKEARKDISELGKDLKQGFTNLLPSGLAGSLGLLGVAGAITAIGTAMGSAVVSGLRFNAMLEMQQIAFETLLGSATAAAERVQFLKQFAAETPFEMGPLVEANRILQSLTDGALATAEGMRLVGDAASSSGGDIINTAMWIGRLYAGLKTGTPVGEATLRLIELGLISGTTAKHLQELAISGEGAADAFQIVADTFGKFSGNMIKQSQTLSGLWSTLKDEFRDLMGTITASFGEELKTGLALLIEGFRQLKLYVEGVGLALADVKAMWDSIIQMQQAVTGAIGMAGAAMLGPAGAAGPAVNLRKNIQGAVASAPTGPLPSERGVTPEEAAKAKQDALDAQKAMEEKAARDAQVAEFNKTMAQDRIDWTLRQMEANRRAEQMEIEEDNAKRARAKQEEVDEAAKQARRLRVFTTRKAQEREMGELMTEQQKIQADWTTTAVEKYELLNENARKQAELLRQQAAAMRELAGQETEALQRAQLEEEATSLEDQASAVAQATDALPDPQSFKDQWQGALTELQDELGTIQQMSASAFKSVFMSSINTVSEGLTAVVLQTKGWQQQLAMIPQTIGIAIVSAIIKMGVQWIATRLLMAVAGRAIETANQKFVTGIAAKYAAIWAPAATLATIATYGTAAEVAPAAIGISQGIVAGESVGSTLISARKGGYTGDGPLDQIAGYVHRRELVVPAEQVEAMGGPNAAQQALAAISGMNRGEITQSINLLMDKDEFTHQMRSNIGSIALDALSRNTLRLVL